MKKSNPVTLSFLLTCLFVVLVVFFATHLLMCLAAVGLVIFGITWRLIYENL